MAEEYIQYLPSSQVARNFVELYYNKLVYQVDDVHKFFTDASIMARIDGNRKQTATATRNINRLVKTLNYTHIHIKSKQCLVSLSNGILLMVWGSVVIRDISRWRMFVETFFLAPQPRGLFVLSDIFQFIDEEPFLLHPNPLLPPRNSQDESISSNSIEQANKSEDTESPKLISPEKVDSSPEEQQQETTQTENIPDDESNPEEKQQKFTEPENIPEDELSHYLRVGTITIRTSCLFGPTQDPIFDQSNATIIAEGLAAATAIGPSEHGLASLPDPVKENGVGEASGSKDKVEVKKVFVRNIPRTMTIPEIAGEFNKFGTIKSDGLAFRSPKDSRTAYGFVEFEDASSAENAIQASVVQIGAHRLRIERLRPRSNVSVQEGRGTRYWRQQQFSGRGFGRGSYR